MPRKQDWHRTRSTHADVLESLERVIAMHPAGSARRRADRAPARDGEPNALAPVVELRPRLVLVHGDGTPAGADDYDTDPFDAA